MRNEKPVYSQKSLQPKALGIALLACILGSFALAAFSPVVYATDGNYSVSIPFNPFYTTTATYYSIPTNETTATPWEAEIVNSLTYNGTSNSPGAVVALAEASSTTSEQIDLVFYGKGALDVVYVDPTSGASIKIASGEWAQSCTTTSGVESCATTSPIWVDQLDNGTITVSNSTSLIVPDFSAAIYTVNSIGASGNTNSPSGKNFNTAGGYLSVILGVPDVNEDVSGMSDAIYAVIPAIVLVGVVGWLMRFFKGFNL